MINVQSPRVTKCGIWQEAHSVLFGNFNIFIRERYHEITQKTMHLLLNLGNIGFPVSTLFSLYIVYYNYVLVSLFYAIINEQM